MLHKTLILITLSLISTHCKKTYEDKRTYGSRTVQDSKDFSPDEFYALQTASEVWKTHNIAISFDPETGSDDLIATLTIIEKAVDNEKLLAELKRIGHNEIHIAREFNVIKDDKSGRHALVWAAEANVPMVLEYLESFPGVDQKFTLWMTNTGAAWSRHNISLVAGESADKQESTAILRTLRKAAHDPAFVAVVKQRGTGTFTLGDLASLYDSYLVKAVKGA